MKGTEPAARYRSTWYLLSKCGMPVSLSALQTKLNTKCPTPAAAARSTMSSPCAVAGRIGYIHLRAKVSDEGAVIAGSCHQDQVFPLRPDGGPDRRVDPRPGHAYHPGGLLAPA